jgi:CelD/BcsL family acetyltransferase involved in cellulose biosynthesis
MTMTTIADATLPTADPAAFFATPARESIGLSSALSAARALDSHPMASLFSSAEWVSVLTATYGFDLQASVLRKGSETKAALLFGEIEDIRGRRILSLPFSDYLDPLVDDAATWQRLVAPLLDRGAPLRLRVLRSPQPIADSRFTTTGTALWHCVDLTRGEDEIWTSLRDNARQNIRRAERGGVTVRAGDTVEDLASFYGMHCHVRKSKYRLFAQPFAFLENMRAAFAPSGRLTVLLAELDGSVIAGILFLVHGDTLYYKFNASTEAALRPNELLIWTGIRMGKERGLKRLDFGLSDISQPGLVRFKQKFATEERTISILQSATPALHSPRDAEAGRVLGRLTEILTDPSVPDAVTRCVGDEVYRFFC